MNAHASINRIFRVIWNEALGSWVAVSEISRSRGKRNGRCAAVLVSMTVALGLGQPAHAAGPAQAASPLSRAVSAASAAPVMPGVPAPNALPTGGSVVAGSATIAPGSTPGTAVLNIDQSTQRAVIDWNTFNLGSAAQVNFTQVNSSSVTLNRVLDSNASQIFGKITATGQVYLLNPNGVYFGKTASVDVGSLAVTSENIGDAEFMAGHSSFARDGATGSVVNDGHLQAGIGGYIALLAPEVRNNGVVIARMGTVALASGESITLNFNGNHLAGITVKPSSIAALVENKGAVLAPGGLIILSAQALDHLLGGVVNNSGTLEATGFATKGGRILLEASASVENSGKINANAGTDGSPAGSVAISAPAIENSGTISAAAPVTAAVTPTSARSTASGGSILLNANTLVQTATGKLDVSGAHGGSVTLNAAQDITAAGSINAAATANTAIAVPENTPASSAATVSSSGYGGAIALTAGGNITLQSALLDVSGDAGGGQIIIKGGGQSPMSPPLDPPTVALLGDTELRGSSRRGKGGSVTLTGDRVGLFDASSIDVSGATGGGDVFVGGGFHGQDTSIANAQQTLLSSSATIDASATQTGDGGQVAVWSDGQTSFAGSITARGGATSGAGGFVEVSGKGNLEFIGTVDAGAAHGAAGILLLDPQDITVQTTTGGATLSSNTLAFGTNPSTNSIIDPTTITAVTNLGTAVTLQASDDLIINSSVVTTGSVTGGALIFQAGRSITVNATVTSNNGNISFTANDFGATATSTYRLAGTASFTNTSVIDAGSGTVTITMGTFAGTSGSIETGHVNAANLTIAQNGPTGGAVNGAIDLGESDLIGNLRITASSDTNVTNTLGTTGNAGNVVVRGTASSISVGAGNVTINGPHTDFNIIGLTAGNVILNNAGAMQFATTNLSGNLTETTLGPIASTGSVQVAGTTTLTANNGGYGIGDPYISLANAANHFGGAVTLSVNSTGATGTGGYATLQDSGAITINSSNTATSLAIQAGAAVTTTSVTAGTSLSVNAGGAVSLGTTGLGTSLAVSTSGAITNTGALTVPQQTTLAAGAANNITLDNASNDFNSVQILSGNNVTLVDKNAINFGNYLGWYQQASLPSSISGNLTVTASGDISQSGYNNTNASAISVGGTVTFTANNASAPINLWLGTNNPFNPGSGSSNNFAGAVTLARNNTNTGFSTVELRNVNSGASVLTGLTSVGTLAGVYLTFDNAPSVTLPGMTVTGNLEVYAGSVANTATTATNVISQTGPIVVSAYTIMAAGSTGDIVLTNPANNFAIFGIANTGARNLTLVDMGALQIYAPGFNQGITGNLSITTNGAITDVGNSFSIGGTGTLNAGAANNITLTNEDTYWTGAVSIIGNNVSINPATNLILNNSTINGTFSVVSRRYGYTLTQLAGSAVDVTANGTTTFGNFSSGITLAETGNVFGPLYIYQAGAISLRENAAITQAQGWSNYNNVGYNVTLVTSNDQAISLTQSGNFFGPLTITQVNTGSSSPGAVTVDENGNSTSGMTEGGAWTVHGTTTLNSGSYSINLTNPGNVFGPLRVLATTGTTGSTPVASTVTIYAKNAATDAITDVGATGAWSTGADIVSLVAYSATGAAGTGNITLTNAANALGALYLKGSNVSITNNASITDGPSTVWDAASGGSDTGWVTTGTTTLIVVNPTNKTIALSNLNDLIGPIALSTTGAAGTLTSVLITDNENLTQAGAWIVGAAPVTLDSRTFQVSLPNIANVMGNLSILTSNGTPSAVAITENAPITQGSAWALTGVPVTLIAEGANPVTLTTAANIMGNLAVTGGAVSITENGSITQAAGAAGAWTTTGITTLNPTAGAITLTNAANVFGPLAIPNASTPSSVSITANANITQASAWVQAATPFTLNAGTNNLVLTQANNQLGPLKLTAQNAQVTETGSAGITDNGNGGGAWTVPGLTTLIAGTANPILLSNVAGDFGTVSIVSAASATVTDANTVNFAASTITGGTLTVSAGGAITQSGAIIAPSLRLIGTGDALLTNTANNVSNLAAGFSGGDLSFTNSGNFAVAVVGGTSGITIGAHNVTLSSVAGTMTGLANVNASSSSLTVSTGTALSLPQLSIAGPQTYIAGGSGITLTTNLTSTAAGAVTFNSPVTLAADLTVQSDNSPILFASTVTGATYQLGVNAGTGTASFQGAVSGLGKTSDAQDALSLASGGATFASTVSANNGLAVTGPVVFTNTVTLGNGSAASVFTGLVTLGNVGGMNLSGYNNMSFDGGVLLQNGPAVITSNNSALIFQNAQVTGPYALTLSSGTAALTGLNLMGSNLTSLTVTGAGLTIPSSGISIAGPQSYTASSGGITLGGNVTSTAAGTVSFNSPVNVGASSSIVTVNSPVLFAATVDGNSNLSVNSGSGATTFTGAAGGIAPLGSGTGAALTLLGAGTTTFDSTLAARSGLAATGPVVFDGNVTLTGATTGSTFAGLVTTGGASGNTISGFTGIAFDGGLNLVGGPVTVASNGSTISFVGAVSGAENLTLNALAGGAGTVTGLDQIGTTSTLTALNVTAQTLSLPSTGLAVAGPMSFTAAGGITANGAVGSFSSPATGAISFTGPVSLATGPIAITTDNAAINFGGSINGAQALAVNAGTGTTSFGAAVGATIPLASLTTGSGGGTAINGGSIHTSGAQSFNDAVTLGAATTLTGVNVQFAGRLDGPYALSVNDSGTTAFGGVVGGLAPLVSITTDAPGSVAVNTTAVTTTGAQTYHENMTLGTNAALNGVGLTFGGTLNGPFGLTANAGSGALQFVGAVGATTPLTSLAATGNTITAAAVATSGTQSYAGNAGVTLSGAFVTTDNNFTVTGPTTLGGDVVIQTTGGNIAFAGATSTINGDHNLTLAAGAGNVVLGGVVGGTAALAGITVSGYNLTLPDITTVGDANQSYTALNNITLNQSRTLNAPINFTAGGSFILLTGVSLTASNNTLSIQAADLDLQGTSTLSSGSGLMTLTAVPGNNIALGGFATGYSQAGQMTISGDELSRISTSGGLNLVTSGAGWVQVNGITAPQSGNIHGALDLIAQGTGNVSFITAPSAFNALTGDAVGGTINVGVNLTANNSAITFLTPVSVSGASTISSTGGAISFDSTLAVVNNLTLATRNGALTFVGAVGSTQALTLNLGGGSVTGLGELQSTLTGLTVNSTSGITLPTFTINGPQVYNTGVITATGNLGGVGLAFNNVVNVVPTAGTALTMTAGTGTLAFGNSVAFNANNMTLTADQINFAAAVTGSGSLTLQPYTASRNVEVGSSAAPITGLNLTHADMGWLPIGTLSGLTLGSAAGTGTLDVGGALNAPGVAVTLNGGGGITQSGGSVVSGPLTVYAAGNGIALNNGANAFGAVGINGTPSSVSLVNTLAVNQLGTAAWNLGSAPVTLNSGTQDITLNNAGNTFGTIVLNGGNAQVTEAAATDIGASNLTKNLTVVSSGGINFSGALAALGNVSLTSAGVITQAAPLTIGGNLAVVTTVNAGDVVFDNSGAAATSIGNTQVGGNYTLTATNEAISQAAGTSLQVAGHLTLTSASLLLSGAGNLVGGGQTLTQTSTVGTNVIDSSGVITLGNDVEAGNLTVISEASSRTFSGTPVHGAAITLNNAMNNIAGTISASASVPTIQSGTTDVQTGILQTPGTALSVAGVASFTAQPSTVANSGLITLADSGNTFGTLLLSGSTVNVANSAPGLTGIGGALATTNLTLVTAGGVTQSGAIVTPALAITAAGPVTLVNANNAAGTLSVTSAGNAISYVNSTGLVIAGIDAGGANVGLTAGGTGGLTQTGALLNVATLSANAGGAVVLTNTANTIGALGASVAGTGMQVYDANGVAVSGIVQSAAGDVVLRAVGDLTLNAGGQLQAVAGNVIASTEGAGNFINDSTALGAALVVGTGNRWLVYSDTPDLVGTTHTVKGGLASNFRHYGNATYTSYAPGAVTESGDGFIYDYATPTLTVAATIVGAATQVYGTAPTGAPGYTISSGLVDSEDNVGNVISGGTATYDHTLASFVNAGTYAVKYVNGLTSNYTLLASATGAMYTVTPAVLTYTANPATRAYGAANPTFGGTLTGYKLGDTASVLAGTVAWTTPAVVGSNVGSYAIDGGGYSLISGTNYTFAQAAGNAAALTVGQAGLTVTALGATQSYNGLAYSGGNGVTYSGFANGDGVASLGGTLAYGGTSQGARNAGTYVITPSGLTDGNYAVNFASGNLVLSRANLTLTTSNVTKTYNGTFAALGTVVASTLTPLFGSDTVSGGTFAFTNANAGSGNKTVTVSGATVNDTNGGGNYNVSYVSNTTSTITPANLTVDTSNITKTYNATLAASGTAVLASGTLFRNASNAGVFDSLSGGTFAFTDANAGVSDKTVTTAGVTVNDGNLGGNYTVTYANNTTSTINQAPLLFVGSINAKTYDGTTLATLSGDTLSGFIGTQTVTAGAAAANFADKNAGTLKSVTISGITLANGTNGGLAANYAVGATSSATGTITPKVLTANATVANKVYDGTTSATLQTYGLSGFVGNETVLGVNTGTATFADKNVGDNKPVAISGITLVNGANGGLATNYVVSTVGTSDADITPAALRVAGIVALNTVYNGTLAADVDTQGALLTGVIGLDNVQVGSIAGTYATKDVGIAKPITTSAFVLTGTDSHNYALVQPTGLTATVTPFALTVSATGVNKVYDTTTSATVILTDNPFAGDLLSINSTAAFLDKNAGTGKYIAISGIALGGASAADYTVAGSIGAYATITPATLAITAAGVNKVYDATSAATVNLTDTPLGNDAVTLVYGSASFANKNVGADKVVSVDGISASGAAATNYIISTLATTTADVTPATITQVTGVTAANKVYDGTTAATLVTGSLGFVGMMPGDNLTATATNAVFNNKNAGIGKTVSIGGLVLGGTDAANYVLPASGPTTSTATITPAALLVSATARNKVYDGTVAATVTLTDDRIAGDMLTIGSSDSFLNKNAGVGKYVSVSDITLGGQDAGNYTVNGSAAAYATITAAPLVVVATGVNRTYDATTGATVTLAETPLGGDVVNASYGSASFGSKNVGNGKIINVNNITLSGADAGNYSTGPTATSTADVTPATLVVGASASNKPYDATTAATVLLTGNAFAGDQIVLTHAPATFSSPGAGNGKTVTVTGIEISGGADRGNYILGDNNTSATADIDVVVSQALAGTWVLVPVIPEQLSPTLLPAALAPSVTTPAISQLDLTLPAGFGGGVPTINQAAAGMAAAADIAADAGQVTVELVQPWTSQSPGMVSVSVPAEMVTSGKSFSFALPESLVDAARGAKLQITQRDGKRLPSWLRYERSSNRMSASAAPASSLPLELLTRSATRSWILTISEDPVP
jgi:filamentous hemagglutinin family protein